MFLKEYCMDITRKTTECKESDKNMGRRVMCPEYSINQIDVKSFPKEERGEVFILLWNIEAGGHLAATIKPYPQEFIYQCEYTPGITTQLHTHDYIELAYIVEGKFCQRIMGKDILFKKGELCLIDKNCPHQDFLEEADSVVLFIGLANEIFDEVMVRNIEEEKILNFLQTALMKQKNINQYLHFKPKNQEDGTLERYLLGLVQELETNDTAAAYICKGIIMRILHHISTEYEFNLSNEERKKMKWLIFEEVAKYIGENYRNITVKELATRFHFNEDYFNRLFREKTGGTYLEYLQEVRLKHAHRLLRTTDESVEEIAEQVGYQNKGYFYKIFVDRYGMTPAKVRKKTDAVKQLMN
ncbi:AraC family transcriptional regulator [Anaerocolumna chitinilytica]|uniref:HTH araC/xylS-type domain-containing protein n=1 Tax=Anaerocolumna chitinilytica TaxID=1727145 RepID=A0A7I8DKN4_9FIRM|nr:AraC family transcriptional regulator [Anaerocolumna chitinilytica]BCJ97894.1 hypothetical protein bsdcttw_09350 [Anaerocolumna chitinilytica]